MISAREYYYSKVAPNELGVNYHTLRRQGLEYALSEHPELESSYRRALNHVPTLSNDLLLEELTRELIERTDGVVRERLERIFVAKRATLLANAGAYIQSGEIEGDLVFFNVGLSDAALQYAILFRGMISVKQAIRQGNLAAASDLLEDAKRLASAQGRWRISGDVIQLTDDDALQIPEDSGIAVGIATMTDRFILSHEIAHHLLGHTGGIDHTSHFIERSLTTDAQARRDKAPRRRREEYDADWLAILILAGITHSSVTKVSDVFANQAALGSLLTLTVIGQISNPSISSGSHPSPFDRYSHCLEALSTLQTYQPVAILRDIRNFHRLLYRTQGVGLGASIDE